MRYTQHVGSLTWDFCKPAVDDRVMNQLERDLDVSLPPDLRQVLQRCHGGDPVERAVFWFEHPEFGYMGSGLGALLTLEPPDDINGILVTLRNLREFQELPSGVIPFATDGGGDYICLDYRGASGRPTIVYWSHEAEPESSIAHLAENFTDFLAGLVPRERLSGDPDTGED